jgi:uncharacterized protein (TIGR02996 family)
MQADEAAFLAEIHADPYDDTVRLVYADWLEQQGDVRSEYLRLECELNGLRPGDALFDELRPRFDEIRRQCDRNWLAAVGRTRIANCVAFALRCPKRWENLTELKQPGQRFCTACGKTVHYCQTRKEIVERAIDGDCIAIDTGILKHEFDEAHREGVRYRAFESGMTLGIPAIALEEPDDT